VHNDSGEKTGRRILIAENNTANSTLLLRTLENLGHEVVIASNARQALAEFGAARLKCRFETVVSLTS
jgi:CheY-like chemotaxis protein